MGPPTQNRTAQRSREPHNATQNRATQHGVRAIVRTAAATENDGPASLEGSGAVVDAAADAA